MKSSSLVREAGDRLLIDRVIGISNILSPVSRLGRFRPDNPSTQVLGYYRIVRYADVSATTFVNNLV